MPTAIAIGSHADRNEHAERLLDPENVTKDAERERRGEDGGAAREQKARNGEVGLAGQQTDRDRGHDRVDVGDPEPK